MAEKRDATRRRYRSPLASKGLMAGCLTGDSGNILRYVAFPSKESMLDLDFVTSENKDEVKGQATDSPTKTRQRGVHETPTMSRLHAR